MALVLHLAFGLLPSQGGKKCVLGESAFVFEYLVLKMALLSRGAILCSSQSQFCGLSQRRRWKQRVFSIRYLFADGTVHCRGFAEKDSLPLSLDAHRSRFMMGDPIALALHRVAGPHSQPEKIKFNFCCHLIAWWRSALYWHSLI